MTGIFCREGGIGGGEGSWGAGSGYEEGGEERGGDRGGDRGVGEERWLGVRDFPTPVLSYLLLLLFLANFQPMPVIVVAIQPSWGPAEGEGCQIAGLRPLAQGAGGKSEEAETSLGLDLSELDA
eukprot:762622-Hanusia_phi.AAC.1